MLEIGLIEEVRGLLDAWYSPQLQSMQGIGYKETVEYLSWHLSLEKLQELITIHTQQYAKRQRTWFRRYINDAEENPKEGVVYRVYEIR
jgi:tRNA dimethylallyltransferase